MSARILVVDDERANIEILLRCLGQKGHPGLGVGSVEDAERELSRGQFDIVLLDQVLPDTTGMQALPRLRALTQAAIYMMSGYSDDETRRDAELVGADGFLPKPIVLEALYDAIAALPERSA